MPGKRQAGWPSLLVTFLLATQEKSDSVAAGDRPLFASNHPRAESIATEVAPTDERMRKHRESRPMTPESIMEIGQHALYVAMLVAAPLLLTALAVGLLVGVIQAATQINEMTLSFIPKLIAMALVALITGPWMLRLLVQYTTQLIESLPGAVR
jgi:flagellar biosynthesis protein FliQ